LHKAGRMIRKSVGIAIVSLLLLAGCTSGTSDSPVLPISDNQAITAPPEGHYLWGYYDILVDPGSDQPVEITPVRSGSFHLNIRRFLEEHPCHDCLKAENVDFTPGGFSIDISITHPFPPASTLYGFDVRGIFFFDGSAEFPQFGVIAPSRIPGDGYLANPDGYATIFNPVEYQGNNFLSYTRGNLVPPDMPDPNSTLGAYKAFFSDGQSEDSGGRRGFFPGDTVLRRYEIMVPGNGPFHYGYAIDSSWEQPISHPVTSVDDFPPSANMAEPFRIDVTELDNSIYTDGGSVTLEIVVFDHQGSDGILECRAEAPGLTDAIIINNLPEIMDQHTARFVLEVPNDIGSTQSTGEEILIQVIHDTPDTNLGLLPSWSFLVTDIAQLPPNPVIYGIDPDTGYQYQLLDTVINGAGFVPGASVQLYQGLISIEANNIEVLDPFTINATFNLDGPFGFYTLYVENPGGEWGELAEAFEVQLTK